MRDGGGFGRERYLIDRASLMVAGAVPPTRRTLHGGHRSPVQPVSIAGVDRSTLNVLLPVPQSPRMILAPPPVRWLGQPPSTDVIEYLQESLILKKRLGGRRLCFTDAKRRLARKANALRRRLLSALDTLVTPDALMRWYRELIAIEWNYNCRRGLGRPAAYRRFESIWQEAATLEELRPLAALPPARDPWWRRIGIEVSKSRVTRDCDA